MNYDIMPKAIEIAARKFDRSSNYQRLIVNTISGAYNTSNNSKTVEKLRDELTGRIANSMERVFEDLKFSSLGDPLSNGSFYFTKAFIQWLGMEK